MRFDLPAPFAPMRTLSGRSSIFASRIDFHPASRRLVNCATSRPPAIGALGYGMSGKVPAAFLPPFLPKGSRSRNTGDHLGSDTLCHSPKNEAVALGKLNFVRVFFVRMDIVAVITKDFSHVLCGLRNPSEFVRDVDVILEYP